MPPGAVGASARTGCRTRVRPGPLACPPMNDDVRNIVLGLVAAGISASLGWIARTYLWKRKLRRKQAFFGLPDNSESLLVVNRDPATAEPAVHRFDVFALLELSALVKDCGAHVQVVTQDAAHQGFGERTEFCVGGPGSNRRMVAHMAAMLPGCGSTSTRSRVRPRRLPDRRRPVPHGAGHHRVRAAGAADGG